MSNLDPSIAVAVKRLLKIVVGLDKETPADAIKIVLASDEGKELTANVGVQKARAFLQAEIDKLFDDTDEDKITTPALDEALVDSKVIKVISDNLPLTNKGGGPVRVSVVGQNRLVVNLARYYGHSWDIDGKDAEKVMKATIAKTGSPDDLTQSISFDGHFGNNGKWTKKNRPFVVMTKDMDVGFKKYEKATLTDEEAVEVVKAIFDKATKKVVNESVVSDVIARAKKESFTLTVSVEKDEAWVYTNAKALKVDGDLTEEMQVLIDDLLNMEGVKSVMMVDVDGNWLGYSLF